MSHGDSLQLSLDDPAHEAMCEARLRRPASPTHDPALEARVAAKLDVERAAAEVVALVRAAAALPINARGAVVIGGAEATRLRLLLARIPS